MKNKVLGTLMIAALVASGSSTLVSCKDTESDDIQQTNNSIASLNASLQQKINELQGKIDALKSCSCDPTAFATLQQDVATLKNLAKGSEAWTEEFNKLKEKVDKLSPDDTSWKTSLEELSQSINAIALKESNDSTALADHLKVLDKFCNDLLTSLVTNTEVQSTYSPAAGSFNFQEAGIASNTLLTYWGNNANDSYIFPTKDPNLLYTDDDEASLSTADLSGDQATIPSGTLLDGDGAEGNAGTLYVTVNPSTAYEGKFLTVSLEKTNGKSSPIKLTDEGPVDFDLKTGYTRAAENSNVRAIKATISKDDIDNIKLTIADKEQLKAALKKLVNERDQTKASLKELAKAAVKAVYDNLNSQSLYGLTTNFGLTNGTTTKYAKNFGKANILTGAFQPLSFGAFDNIADASNVPGIERAESVLKKFINKIELKSVPVNGTDLSTITRVNSLGKISTNSDGTYKLDVEVTGKKNDGTPATATGYLTLSKDELKGLLGAVSTDDDMTKAINAYNEGKGSLNFLLADLNEALSSSVAVDDAKSDAVSRIDSYFDKLNSRYAYWFNRVKKAALHPCMLFVGTNAQGVAGVHRLTAAGATVTGTSIKLIPTSYTYNLLAPAYKKFVKVYSGSDVRFAKVIPGDQYEVNVEGLKSGEKYTVVYEAVDYSGKVMARKYTLNVK